LGTNGAIVPGDIQRMSAGTGVMHSEMNLQKTAPVHFLQIWILPRERGTKPGYAQRSFSAAEKHNTLAKLATGDGDRDGVHADGSVGIGADVDLYAGVIDAGVAVGAPLARSRHGFVQVVKGAVRVNGVDVEAGDGVAVSEEDRVDVVGVAGSSEVIVFDLG
jgi:redox-sensitive bicupin YhaK (pirin superfamily)